jgi:hypothetical protein
MAEAVRSRRSLLALPTASRRWCSLPPPPPRGRCCQPRNWAGCGSATTCWSFVLAALQALRLRTRRRAQQRPPTSNGEAVADALEVAMTVNVLPSGSKRPIPANSTGTSRPTSSTTAANTSSGGAPTRHQRREPAQRGLLLGQHTQLLTAQAWSPSPRDRAARKGTHTDATTRSRTRRSAICGRSAETSGEHVTLARPPVSQDGASVWAVFRVSSTRSSHPQACRPAASHTPVVPACPMRTNLATMVAPVTLGFGPPPPTLRQASRTRIRNQRRATTAVLGL